MDKRNRTKGQTTNYKNTTRKRLESQTIKSFGSNKVCTYGAVKSVLIKSVLIKSVLIPLT
jgi:hypothetical protein